MESGRIEPLRAPPVHREAQLCLQPPQWAKYLDGNTRHTGGPGGLEALEAAEAWP